jgi:hypothetical protein
LATRWTRSRTGWNATATTAADGSYSFTGLTAGSYNIRQVPPGGYVFVSPVSGGQTVNPGAAQIVTADFGDFPITYTGSQMYLRLDPTSTNVQVWVDQPTSGAPTYSANTTLVATSTLGFTGTNGDDSLTVDAANGNPLPASGGASFNARGNGALGDVLVILGKSGSAENVVFDNGSASLNGLTITPVVPI